MDFRNPFRSKASAVPQRLTFSRGFTLVEMAVVLVIVALLIAGMMIPLSAQQDIRARQETEKTLNDIREALVGFAVANGRLPRPATSATNGAENQLTCATNPSLDTPDADCNGFIPWATLGVPKIDGWGKLIRYSVTPAFADATITLTLWPNRTVQTRDNLGNLSYLAGVDDPPPDGIPDCTTPTRCAPAVVFSQGRRNWGTNEAGAALADESTTNADEDANNNGATNFFSRLPATDTAVTGGEFDDLVVWLPTSILFNRLIAAGKLP